jgi:DNA-binding CsgD family transcriptional regulator
MLVDSSGTAVCLKDRAGAQSGDTVVGFVPGLLGRAGECAVLDELLSAIRHSEGRSLIVRGEAGIGKTALLEHMVQAAPDLLVLRASGVESEMELAYAGLHQLCGPLLDSVERLPDPQRHALEVVFGLCAGPTDRFLVGLGVLSLLSEASEEQPVLCVVDDAQWLDRTSALVLKFAARRLQGGAVGLVFAARGRGENLQGLPSLELRGLGRGDASALLSSAARPRLDEQVRDRIVSETHGNPLALLELHRGLNAAELAGFGMPVVSGLPNSVEASVRRRIAALPEGTRRLLLIASADPLGEPTLVWRAAELLGIGAEMAGPAVEEGLCEFAARIRFRHPLVRAAAYGAGSADERRRVHAALAEATDRAIDPDRRAWHRALASLGPDDVVADELEQSAVRAQARGGQPAAAAFLERATDLTADSSRRAERAVAAAEANYLAGSGEGALRLISVAESVALDELQRIRVDVLRGRIASAQPRVGDAWPLLLLAARRLERLDRRLARETYRDAFVAAFEAGGLSGDTGLSEVAAAVRSAGPATDALPAPDKLLDAAALLVAAGHTAGAGHARRTLAGFRDARMAPEVELRWLWLACRMAWSTWDDDSWDVLTIRAFELVRRGGALALLPMAGAMRVARQVLAGDLTGAQTLIDDTEAVLRAIGGERLATSRFILEAYRGHEREVAELERTTHDAVARSEGQLIAASQWARAVLYNGLGRYDDALAAAQVEATYPISLSHWPLSELVEAAARSGRPELAGDALTRLGELARAYGTDWIVGVEARARALVADAANADELYRQAIEHLGRTRLRAELARAHLLYGEWLRREGRRVDAREQLRVAHDMLTAIGMQAFAERARKELAATGERARKRTAETRDDLTAQEWQIAQLARDGLSNPEIGARLFLSPKTVEWHLHKVFGKLGIRSRHGLANALAPPQAELAHA